MKKILLSCSLFLLLTGVAHAQSNPLDKKLEKAKELAENKKYKESDEYLTDLLEKNPEYGAGWDLLANIRYAEYEESKMSDNLFGGKMTVTTKDKNGKEIPGNDSLAQSLMKMLNKIKPSERAYNGFLYGMRQGAASSLDADMCSSYLRKLNIDIEIDTNVSKKALKYFNEAEKEFENKNYNGAALLYKRAAEEQPDFYKARLYMGDCFYFTGNYAEAINVFKEATEKFPFLLEPRKYLTDAYAKAKLYDKALEAAIGSTMVYPDLSMFQKLDDAAYMAGKKLDVKWTPRGILPNKIEDTTEENLNEYKPQKPWIAKGPWVFYEKAGNNIQDYCNKKGIITKPNNLTKSKYLEVYSWEEMLKNSNDPSLAEAKRMQQDGYLDCYVLVSCFHYDFYYQYKDFVANNRDKIAKYYKRYIVSQ